MAEALQRVDGQAGDDGARTALARADWPAALDEAMRVFSIDASVLQMVDGDLRFTHQLLQESLAADVLLDASRSGQRPASDFWPEQRGWKRTGWEVVAEIAGEACGVDVTAQHRLIAWLSASTPKVALDVWKHLNRPVLPAEVRQEIAAQWCPRLTDVQAEPAPESRAAIGEWLGALDLDHRPGTGLRPDGVPDIDWVRIGDFEIGRYLVTNRQWQAFIDDGGYGDGRWWVGLAERMTPQSARWSEPTAPRETVSWYEAMAYCRWLSVKLGAVVMLPTEAQWEWAACGGSGREFAWGNEWNLDLVNAERCIGRTTVVGLYPNGATPESVQDMTGNVWEWCLNEYDNPQNSDPTGSARRVVRGGVWDYPSVNCRASYRSGRAPVNRSNLLGLRLVRASPCLAAPLYGSSPSGGGWEGVDG
ncbi:formylglycine-generating enzyme family protein [Sphaerotilus sp.]|uniref:formylglycine-generating enzyme family protein n=1 Tax=Sphaerotilus sp. TaxID=2093942 RepID=UPI002ACDA43B|nr:SUMF1/EgtB/PvdO family nonheme iron enzyme [Sphaerotilus sp.]MDZ7858720.1 SUMF1/EgtB/PvdO family nonheme iron enzyme [Sphaerotilus sp.]